MIVYHAEEMCKLAYSKSHIGKEKAEVMNKIYEAASQGYFQACFLIGDFADYRLIVAWLADLGYRCVHVRNDNKFYVRWEKRI